MASGGKRKNAGRPSLGETEQILLRMKPELKEALKLRAQEEGKSLNAVVVEILTAAQ
ncbi:MAG: toxin-antitoxin system HicB family antitoxin [Actinomycetota bacterium]|nr:toxin-antitoxin system HicB family antitoxin [Actinomycetota bacterium]